MNFLPEPSAYFQKDIMGHMSLETAEEESLNGKMTGNVTAVKLMKQIDASFLEKLALLSLQKSSKSSPETRSALFFIFNFLLFNLKSLVAS